MTYYNEFKSKYYVAWGHFVTLNMGFAKEKTRRLGKKTREHDKKRIGQTNIKGVRIKL